MSAAVPQADRRSEVRNPCDGLAVTLRVRGQWFNRPATALDFSSDGIALLWPNSLAKDRTVFLSLRTRRQLAQASGELAIDNLVGVVHNCTPCERGYRLGIRFRIASELQLDRCVTNARLEALCERLFAEQTVA